MKRKSFRRALSAVLSLALLLVLPGCGEETVPHAEHTVPPLPSYAPPENYPTYTGQWEETEEPLTIYIEDFQLVTKLDQGNFQEFLERYLGKPVKLNWIVLPKDSGAAEKLLNQLRIEIAAGGGPDLFLATCPNSWGNDGWLVLHSNGLFPNPEKSMRSDVFLPLDGLLEAPSFMKPELMNQTVFSAGRTPEGQMVLPISYTYDVAGMAEGVLPEGAPLPANRAELLSLESEASVQAMNALYWAAGPGAPSRMLGPLADYDKEELLFTQEELLHWVLEYNNANRAVQKLKLPKDEAAVHAGAVHMMEENRTKWRGKGQVDSLIVPLYNVYNGLTAEVTSYAAINKNTRQANNAMFLLDLLFRPEVLQNKGVQFAEETKVYLRYPLNAQITPEGFGILDGFCMEECNKQDKPRLLALEREHVNAVRFRSEMDRVLFDLFDELEGRAPKTEEEIAELVAQVYSKLQMILQE